MQSKLSDVLTVSEVAAILSARVEGPISPTQVRKICRDTAAGILTGVYAIKAELKGKTWLIPIGSLKNFKRVPRGPKSPRRKAKLTRRIK